MSTLISADFRNGVIQPLHTDAEITKAVGLHVANFILENYPDEAEVALENINRLKLNERYTFSDLVFLASVIKAETGGIKLVDDDLQKSGNYILVALRISAVLILMPKSKALKASQLKGIGANANLIFQSLEAWEGIENNPNSSKHQVKRSRLEQKRVHRLLRNSQPNADIYGKSIIRISKMAWKAIERHGITVIKELSIQELSQEINLDSKK